MYVCAYIKHSLHLLKIFCLRNSRRHSPNVDVASNLRAHVIVATQPNLEVLSSDRSRDPLHVPVHLFSPIHLL